MPTEPAYRADHIGSLLRPPEMLQARRNFDAGKITAAQLNEIADHWARQAIDAQKDAGLSVFTDGEYRRSWWAGAMKDSLDGLIPDPAPPSGTAAVGHWKGGSSEMARETLAEMTQGSWVAASKLTKARSLVGDEAAFLKKNAPGPFKITLAAVSGRASGWYKPGITDKFYPTVDDLSRELMGFLNQEVKELIGMGCSYIQLDSLRYTSWMVEYRREAMIEQGLDLEKELDQQIAWDNICIEGAPRHCRRRRRTPHLPRQQPQRLERRRRLRPGRREALQRDERRPLPARVRHRASRQLRTAALRAARQDGRPRADQLEAAAAREEGGRPAPHRRGLEVRADREPGDQPAVRLRLHRPPATCLPGTTSAGS